jgi:hypothetical protein
MQKKESMKEKPTDKDKSHFIIAIAVVVAMPSVNLVRDLLVSNDLINISKNDGINNVIISLISMCGGFLISFIVFLCIVRFRKRKN